MHASIASIAINVLDQKTVYLESEVHVDSSEVGDLHSP